MIKFYKSLIKLLELSLNVMFVLQIALMITVFLTATYWFLDLIGSSAFDFVRPMAEGISDFVRIFYQEDVEIGGVFIDGSLLLFDILALIFVFLITKSKFYVYRAIENLEFSVKDCQKIFEENFNKALREEAEEKIKQCNNIAILIRFETKSLYVDSKRDGAEKKLEEAFKNFYSTLKAISGCKFAKTDDKMLILANSFDRIDNLLSFIDISTAKIRASMKKDKWALFSYIAIDVYDDKTNFKTKVYPTLEKLLTLRHKNEALCLGNFNLRYKLSKEQAYMLSLKGSYDILNEECDVYTLRKVNQSIDF